jgi:hypothetical protein
VKRGISVAPEVTQMGASTKPYRILVLDNHYEEKEGIRRIILIWILEK